MNSIKIKNHIEKDHREYASYDNKRNIAHISDGLKPSQRKVIYTAIKTLSRGSITKVANLGSRASDFTHYQHGENSIVDTTIGLAQSFPGANNLPLLEGHGQFGTMIDYEASEPRYIYVSLSKNLDSLLKPEDEDILIKQENDGDPIEPKFFLTTLPLLLINGSSGVGNGYSSTILPRDPKCVAKAIKLYVEAKDKEDAALLAKLDVLLLPSFKGFKGLVKKVDRQYQIHGNVSKVGKTRLLIDSLPPDSKYQYESYKKKSLLPLLDKKVIRGFSDNSDEKAWNIEIEAPMEFVNKPVDELKKELKLIWNITETLNCWDWSGSKLLMFNNPVELLIEWINGRLGFIEARRLDLIKKGEEEVSWMKIKSKFIEVVKTNPDWTKLDKDSLAKFIDEKVTDDREYHKRLLALRISSLTMDEHKALLEDIEKRELLLTELRSKTKEKMLLEDVSVFS